MGAPVIEKAAVVIQRAMTWAGVESLSFVEVVGGSSYVAPFQAKLQELTKVESLSHTLNKSEAVARGCALQCAIVSPQFHINKTATITDYNPYSIKLTWTETPEGGEKTTKSAVLFKRGCALNSAKRVTFQKSSQIEIVADYADASEFSFPMENMNIGKFVIPQFKPTVESERNPTVEVMFKLDASGVFTMKHARATEYYTETVPASPKVKTEASPAASPKAEPAAASAEVKTENGEDAAPAVEPDGDAVMEEPKKVERKKVSELLVDVTLASGYSVAKVLELKTLEEKMQAADELAIATAEARNALEAYSYDAQSKLLGLVDDILAWLYGEGDSATKETYQGKLSELQVLGAPIELRKTEAETRPESIEQLMEVIRRFKEFVNSTEEKYAHISEEKRQKVADKINETEDWFNNLQARQNALPKAADPVLLSAEIDKRKDALTRFAQPIVNTPVPKKEEPKKEDTKKDKEDKMDTEKSENMNEDTPPINESSDGETKLEDKIEVEGTPVEKTEAMDVD